MVGHRPNSHCSCDEGAQCSLSNLQGPTHQGRYSSLLDSATTPDLLQQCDETKPVCNRCSKSRRCCVETKVDRGTGLSIHSENSYASGVQKRPRGPRAHLNQLRPPGDLETRAVAYYLEHHLQTVAATPYVSGCLPKCAEAWKISGRSDAMVDLALSCMALAVYSKCHKHPQAAEEAGPRYYRLLQVVQSRIARLATPPVSQDDIDACLMSVFFMGRFEGVMHQSGEQEPKQWVRSLKSWSHRDGCMAILKCWRDNLGHIEPGIIVRDTRRGLIRASLLRNLAVPDWMIDGKPFGEREYFNHEYDRLLVRVVNIYYKLTHSETECTDLSETKRSMIMEAEDLDKGLEQWADRLPAFCSYHQHVLQDAGSYPRKHFYSPRVFSFPRVGHAALWNQYFSARMLLASTHLRILSSNSPAIMCDQRYRQQVEKCTSRLKEMSDNVAATLPFALERINRKVVSISSTSKSTPTSSSPSTNTSLTSTPVSAPPHIEVILTPPTTPVKPHIVDLVVWPLSIASSLDGVDGDQQKWFRSEIAEAGRLIGDGVLAKADGGEWSVI
jgi:hypothetical protein